MPPCTDENVHGHAYVVHLLLLVFKCLFSLQRTARDVDLSANGGSLVDRWDSLVLTGGLQTSLCVCLDTFGARLVGVSLALCVSFLYLIC